MTNPTVFLTHHRDKPFAQAIFMLLKSNGFDVFLASPDSPIPPATVLNQITARTHFVILLIHDSFPNDRLSLQIATALLHQRAIIPFYVQEFDRDAEFQHIPEPIGSQLALAPGIFHHYREPDWAYDELLTRLRAPVSIEITPVPPDEQAIIQEYTDGLFATLQFDRLLAEGNRALAQKDHESALTHYTHAIDLLTPKQYIAYANRALTHYELGNHDAAFADAEIAMTLNDG